ncbi:hypothetical protein ACHAWU_008695 [Discostella pseudostelligera]|uniref:GPI inositol-deacylase n=1 Tax=Discostella pseudostelligera TaxID=259834 RepID=A0ABD3M8L6_9STRA
MAALSAVAVLALPEVAAFTPGLPNTRLASSSSSSSSSSSAPHARPTIKYLLSSSDDDSMVGDGDDGSAKPLAPASTASTSTKKKRMAVLLCPAQFCVPVDYTQLLDTLQSSLSSSSSSVSQLNSNNVEIVATRVAPLPRTEWIKVAKQLPTKNFIDANLSVKVTLDWYFEAMERGLSELMAEVGVGGNSMQDVEICVIGHSIGGWVARAYLGGMSGYVILLYFNALLLFQLYVQTNSQLTPACVPMLISPDGKHRSSTAIYRLAKDRISSLITLGTPHTSPSSALVDQTRGLLREIESSPSCSSQSLHERGIKVTCVGSSGLTGKILTTEIEEIIAATSYLPLVGKLGPDVKGDGIVPLNLAFMESPARSVEITQCSETGNAVRHAHVLPTPWNLIDGSAPSWSLPEDIVWYGSPGVLGQWIQYIE